MAGVEVVRVPPEAAALRKPRLRVPDVVAPTLLLFAGSLALGMFAAWLALEHLASPMVTVPMHVAAIFGMFVVTHECVHHAMGRLTWLNDVAGRLAIPFVSVLSGFPGARYVHLEQHRVQDGGEHLTPWNVRGPAWQLPLRWMLTDFWHAWAYLRRTAGRPQAEAAETLVMLTLLPGTLAAVIWAGHGWALLVVYLLPQRIALGLAAWWFDWYPRRLPPDAYSYHRVHSRHPSLPFYRYPQAWRAERMVSPAAPPAACPGVFHTLTVSSVRPLTRCAVEVGFAVPPRLRDEFAFTPGQHVVLRAMIDGEPVARPYAISSCPGELRVAVKRIPGGLMSTYATTRLRAGDRLDVRPPSGGFTVSPAREVVAIAAGVGISPVLPMLSHLLATSPRSRATLLYVNRSGADTMFADELSALVRRFEGRLRVEHFRTDERDPVLRQARSTFDSIASALVIPDERYHAGPLDTRRLGSWLDCRLHPAKIDEWLLCAPRDIAGPVRALLAEHHVPADAVRDERFCEPVS
ncbi:FAD-binding oxidoreductase [Amycolatopsis sp. GM8]|uniref:FAD-binding oxidoreductase n=1 Tax=Amycolatopsis sp. GM8 TaxID=2896530 RepID=UPI001F37717B|nr:FAD-binding oxidoreductase [Amycolatopsis sp. GM8]